MKVLLLFLVLGFVPLCFASIRRHTNMVFGNVASSSGIGYTSAASKSVKSIIELNVKERLEVNWRSVRRCICYSILFVFLEALGDEYVNTDSVDGEPDQVDDEPNRWLYKDWTRFCVAKAKLGSKELADMKFLDTVFNNIEKLILSNTNAVREKAFTFVCHYFKKPTDSENKMAAMLSFVSYSSELSGERFRTAKKGKEFDKTADMIASNVDKADKADKAMFKKELASVNKSKSRFLAEQEKKIKRLETSASRAQEEMHKDDKNDENIHIDYVAKCYIDELGNIDEWVNDLFFIRDNTDMSRFGVFLDVFLNLVRHDIIGSSNLEKVINSDTRLDFAKRILMAFKTSKGLAYWPFSDDTIGIVSNLLVKRGQEPLLPQQEKQSIGEARPEIQLEADENYASALLNLFTETKHNLDGFTDILNDIRDLGDYKNLDRKKRDEITSRMTQFFNNISTIEGILRSPELSILRRVVYCGTGQLMRLGGYDEHAEIIKKQLDQCDLDKTLCSSNLAQILNISDDMETWTTQRKKLESFCDVISAGLRVPNDGWAGVANKVHELQVRADCVSGTIDLVGAQTIAKRFEEKDIRDMIVHNILGLFIFRGLAGFTISWLLLHCLCGDNENEIESTRHIITELVDMARLSQDIWSMNKWKEGRAICQECISISNALGYLFAVCFGEIGEEKSQNLPEQVDIKFGEIAKSRESLVKNGVEPVLTNSFGQRDFRLIGYYGCYLITIRSYLEILKRIMPQKKKPFLETVNKMEEVIDELSADLNRRVAEMQVNK